MRFILYDRWGNPKGDIPDPVEAVVKRSITNEWSDTLDITCDTQVDKGDRLVLNDGQWREYICVSPEELREDTYSSSLHLVNSVQEIQTARYIEKFHETVVSPRRALEYVLDGTRWLVDEVATDVASIDLTLERVCGYDALQQIANTLNLEIDTRIVISSVEDGVERRYVSLVKRAGDDTRQRFEYGVNLQSVRRTFSDRDVITRLYVYGKTTTNDDGEDEPLTIAGVNQGKHYLDADDATLRAWGVPDGKGGILPAVGVVEHTDISKVNELYDQAVLDLADLSKPQATYEADVASLNAGGVDTGKLDIGDTIQVVDTTFDPPLRLQARIVAYDEDLLEPANSSITLGSIIETVSERQTIVNKTVETVRTGKPIWDSTATTATSAHTTATQAMNEANGLSTRVENAVAVAANAEAKIAPVGVMTDVTVAAGEFDAGLSVVKPVDALPASLVAGPPPTRMQADVWAACRPIVEDHDSDPSIPAGSIRVTVAGKPTGDLIIRLAALKGGTS